MAYVPLPPPPSLSLKSWAGHTRKVFFFLIGTMFFLNPCTLMLLFVPSQMSSSIIARQGLQNSLSLIALLIRVNSKVLINTKLHVVSLLL